MQFDIQQSKYSGLLKNNKMTRMNKKLEIFYIITKHADYEMVEGCR